MEPPAGSKFSIAVEEARFNLMSQMRKLVQAAQLQPRLYWNPDTGQWQIDFDSPSRSNLLAVLVLQLMLAVADKDGYAVCSGCRKTYIPEKQPSPTRRNYCEVCRLAGVPFRDSKRDLRRGEREEDGERTR